MADGPAQPLVATPLLSNFCWPPVLYPGFSLSSSLLLHVLWISIRYQLDLTNLIGNWVCAHLLWSVGETVVGRLLVRSVDLKLNLVQALVVSGSVPPQRFFRTRIVSLHLLLWLVIASSCLWFFLSRLHNLNFSI